MRSDYPPNMKIKDLHGNPDNPRKITDKKLELLKKALEEFGDLGGFVFNRSSKHLIGGHQRQKAFDASSEIVIEERYKKPTRTGTVAEGYVILKGERFKYREVAWDDIREKAATIAANRNAGEWDYSKLGDMFTDLETFGFDLDLTMFDTLELRKILPDLTSVSAHDRDKNGSKEIDEGDFNEFDHKCPKCSFEFNEA